MNTKTVKVLSVLTFFMALGLCIVSCGKDDDEIGSGDSGNDDILGYWVKEDHLNNPLRNGGGGIVTSYGYHFFDNGVVRVFQVQHTGLGSSYSYAEAKTSWEKITVRNGVTFYMNPDVKNKRYTRIGNKIVIDAQSEPIIMTIVGADRISANSSDGWAEGAYVRVNRTNEDTGENNSEEENSNANGTIDTEVFVIEDKDIFMGVNTMDDGWYSYVLQFGCGVNNREDAYNQGLTQIRLTVWSDNGCLEFPYSTSKYGKKKTYKIALSYQKELYNWIYVYSKDTEITFNYKVEYYNSNNGRWYDVKNRQLTFIK